MKCEFYGEKNLEKADAEYVWMSTGGFSEEDKKAFYKSLKKLEEAMDAVQDQTLGDPPLEEAETARRALIEYFNDSHAYLVVRKGRVLIRTTHADSIEFGLHIDLGSIIEDELENWQGIGPSQPARQLEVLEDPKDIEEAKKWLVGMERLRDALDDAIRKRKATLPK